LRGLGDQCRVQSDGCGGEGWGRGVGGGKLLVLYCTVLYRTALYSPCIVLYGRTSRLLTLPTLPRQMSGRVGAARSQSEQPVQLILHLKVCTAPFLPSVVFSVKLERCVLERLYTYKMEIYVKLLAKAHVTFI